MPTYAATSAQLGIGPSRLVPSLCVLGMLAVIFAAMVTWLLYLGDLRRQEEELAQAAIRAATVLDHNLTLRAYSLSAMRLTAEQYLDGHAQLTVNPASALSSTSGGYLLAELSGYRGEELGHLAGRGAAPGAQSAAAREMAMALALTPLFRTVIRRDSDTLRVSYTSERNFSYVLPVSEARPPDLERTRRYYETAEASGQSVFWTVPHQDEDSRGLVVGVGTPVRDGGRLVGAVVADLAISRLIHLLDDHDLKGAKLLLTTEDGIYLAGDPAHLQLLGGNGAASRQVEGEFLLLRQKLDAAPWTLQLVAPRQQLRRNAIRQALPFALVTVLLCGSVVLLVCLAHMLRKIATLSIRDGLTGLHNRRFFDAVAAPALRRAHRDGKHFGLILFDVDHFKRFNDNHGHQAGDTALNIVATSVARRLRRGADLAYRVGGEEFAVTCEAASGPAIEHLAQELREAVAAAAHAFPESEFGHLTVSVGVAIAPPGEETDIEALYRRADAALYRAKANGRNTIECCRTGTAEA